MSLTRRNVRLDSEQQERKGSTIWENEADEFWKKMEPTRRCRRLTNSLGALLVAIVVGGGVFFGVRTQTFANLHAAFALPFAQITSENTTSAFALKEAPVFALEEAPVAVNTVAPIQLDQQQLRGRCRVRGVQSRWHEETCRKLCLRDPYNSACMNGCSYGSLTVTKLVCDKMEATEVSTASRCPDGVSCVEACRAYDDETPFPDLRNSCVRGCSNIVPSACARSLQIYHDLVKGALQ